MKKDRPQLAASPGHFFTVVWLKKRKRTLLGIAAVVVFFLLALWIAVASTDTVGDTSVYVIVPGDSVFQICQRHQVSMKDFKEMNPKIDPVRLQVGQCVLMPNPPLIVALGRKMDQLCLKMGLGDPPFARIAYKLAN